MEQEEITVSVPVMWRGKKFIVTIDSGASLKEFGDEVLKLTDVRADTLKLIVPHSSVKASVLLEPFSGEYSYLRLQDTAILEAKSIRMMGVLKDEIEEVLKSAKENQRIVGFEEEEKRMRMRMSYEPFSSPKLPDGPYVFCGFRTLEIPGIELNPPPSEALKRMHLLAADPGIVAIMNKHRWRVGIMTELAPVGYVGVSPKCLLGFNKNQGEEISLRLRTDDLKGFRKYESIKKTLLHELAHMVYTEHDANFYALDKQLNQEATALDWTRSSSNTLSGVRSWEPDSVDTMLESEITVPHRLGGNITDISASARAASVAAAYHRLAEAASSREQEEPDPDDLILVSGNEAATILKSHSEERFQLDHGPNPDDCSQDQIKLEPDPDDSAASEYMESEPYNHESIAKAEPDPDDTEISSILCIVTTNELEKKGREESDAKDARLGSFDSQLMQSEKYIEKTKCSSNSLEPDENDGARDQNEQAKVKLGGELNIIEANKFTQAEPDPDDKVEYPSEISGAEINNSEPDPDDEELQRIQDPVVIFCNRLTKAIEMLHAEINPTDAAVVLQTLFKIIRNVLENPNDMKYRRLRKANPAFQKSIANYKAAMEVLFLIGFSEDAVVDGIGKAETYLVLKWDDPGLLWLAKSSLEACIS